MTTTIKLLVLYILFFLPRLDAIFWGSTTDITWGSVTNISPSFLINDNPKIASDPNGNAMAVWVADTGTGFTQILASYYKSGTGWSTSPTALSLIGPPGGHAVSPYVAMDSYGNALAIWQRNNGLNFVIQAAYYTRSTGTWSSPTNISTTTQQSITPEVGFDGSGNAIAVWKNVNIRTIQAAIYTASTNTWSSPTSISDPVNATIPHIAVNASGKALAIWQGNIEYFTVIQANAFDGYSWGSATTISDQFLDNNHGSIAIDSSGDGIAIWEDENETINTANYISGSWSSNVIISPIFQTASEPSISIIPSSGNAIATWRHFNGSAELALGATYVFSTNTWSSPITLSSHLGSASGTKIVSASSNNGVDVWQFFDGTDQMIQSVFYDNNLNSWSGVTSLTGPGSASRPNAHINTSAGTFKVFAIWSYSSDAIHYVIQTAIGS